MRVLLRVGYHHGFVEQLYVIKAYMLYKLLPSDSTHILRYLNDIEFVKKFNWNRKAISDTISSTIIFRMKSTIRQVDTVDSYSRGPRLDFKPGGMALLTEVCRTFTQ
jgi:hypothetical protein